MTASETTLSLDDPAARRALGQVYRLLLQLAEDKAADSEDPPQELTLPTASSDAENGASTGV
jgi:hypothetical protein